MPVHDLLGQVENHHTGVDRFVQVNVTIHQFDGDQTGMKNFVRDVLGFSGEL